MLLVDIPTFEEKREIVKVENKKIDHCVVDPVYEYLTYTIGKDIFVMDKQCEKYIFPHALDKSMVSS